MGYPYPQDAIYANPSCKPLFPSAEQTLFKRDPKPCFACIRKLR